MAAQPTRADEIKAIHREYSTLYQILGRSFLVGIGILIGIIWFSSDVDRSAYIINLFTTFLGTLATVLVIDFLNRRRDEQRELRQLQQQLIRDAGSLSNDIAKNAIYQLWWRGWLLGNGGLLQRAKLFKANLQGAELVGANLEGTNLSFANLCGTTLFAANLKGADLLKANLTGANLTKATLDGAYLLHANLEGANFSHAEMHGTDLHNAHLDETTILPDGSHWTPDTDLTQFGCIVE
jgi:uncharacterized protein YjbI with pentapeptide repeats